MQKGKKMHSPLELPERNTALLTLSFQPMKTYFGLLTYRTIRYTFVLRHREFVRICCSSNGKPVQV